MDPMIQLAHIIFEKRPESEVEKFKNEKLIDFDRKNEQVQKQVQQKIQKYQDLLKNPNLSESDQAQYRQ